MNLIFPLLLQMLVVLGLGIYLIKLANRFVRAVERIADDIVANPNSHIASGRL